MIWSILICTLESRKDQFDKLNEHLLKQIKESGLEEEIEILFFSDDGYYPVGAKRNTLVENAKGKYISFIDDDDIVSDIYIKEIYDIIKNNDVDCVGIKGLLISDVLGNKEFIHSIRYNEYSEDETYYYRPPNHLNPVKKEKIMKFKFPITNFGEDADWAMQICKAKVLEYEIYINNILYYYHFSYDTTETQKRGTI